MIFYHVRYHAAALWMWYHDLSGYPCIQLLWYCLQDTTPKIYHTQDSIQLLLENITCNIYIKRQMLRQFMLINWACTLKGQFNVDHQWCVYNSANYLGGAHISELSKFIIEGCQEWRFPIYLLMSKTLGNSQWLWSLLQYYQWSCSNMVHGSLLCWGWSDLSI